MLYTYTNYMDNKYLNKIIYLIQYHKYYILNIKI